MIHSFYYFLFFILCVTATLINGECLPRAVQNLILSPNGTLSWTVSPQESCNIIHFHVNIYRQGQDDYEVYVDETRADVSFLPFCESWVFTVRAISTDGSSFAHVLIARIPMPSDADIALKFLDVTEIDGELRLVWELADNTFRSCADSYRVTVSDKDNGELTDLYVAESFLNLEFLSPCVTYELGVRAINNGRPTEEGPLWSIEYDVAPVRQNPPILSTVSVGPTMANTTWILDSLNRNRCPLRTFYVDGSNYFNISLPISDTPERQVLVSLKSLQPNSMYVLRVSVENSGGISNPAIVGVQTLPLEPGVIEIFS